MPENKKDVFKILDEMKKRVLGISDKTPQGMKGYIASFLPTGEPVNPDDYRHPWKPNMTSLNKVTPPAADGTPGISDTTEIAKRYENLSNTCVLVDNKIAIDEVYQEIPSSGKISQAWEIIINGANVMPLPAEQEEFQKNQRDKYYPRLRKTIKDDDGGDMEVDTKEFKSYQEYEMKYKQAIRNYAVQFQIAMSNFQTAQMWGVVGKTYVMEVDDALDNWTSMGYKQFIEEAKDNLAAMGTDAAAHMIAVAKKKFEAYRIATQGIIPVTSQYVELFPSNWCESNVPNDGWTQYDYSWDKKVKTNNEETTSFDAHASINIGFWSVGGHVEHKEVEKHTDFTDEGLKISFKYALIRVNRPWLDTLLLNMGNWFMVGDYPKGTISKGTFDQLMQDNNSAWLPIIPTEILVIKDLEISTTSIHDHYDMLHKETSGGGSFGYGIFCLGVQAGGNYSHSMTSEITTNEDNSESLKVSGVQILGWLSELVPMSPKLDAPKKEVKDKDSIPA